MRSFDRFRSPRLAPAGVELAGLDALDLPIAPTRSLGSRSWAALWPKLAAVAIAVALWQLVVLAGWRPEYALPGPGLVGQRLLEELGTSELIQAIAITLRRGLIGFAIAIAIGVALAMAVVRFTLPAEAVDTFVAALRDTTRGAPPPRELGRTVLRDPAPAIDSRR